MFWALLLAYVSAYTEEEIEIARGCTKIVIDLFKNDFEVVKLLVDEKPQFDRKKFENKIFSDLIDYCRQNATFEAVDKARFFLKNGTWTEYEDYLKVFLDEYQTEDDLKISEEHRAMRKEVLNSEGGIKYIGDPKHKDQAIKSLKENMAKEGKDPDEILSNKRKDLFEKYKKRNTNPKTENPKKEQENPLNPGKNEENPKKEQENPLNPGKNEANPSESIKKHPETHIKEEDKPKSKLFSNDL
ncbi:hypothetical protein SteCoe_5964 [Stentor coeruleus]|uniref:Uncharacterized protein n=1 Tax=Stentor coeruleus TaxID=5963 RepID=A0A1R2CR56_9CILI|nr:hypothetical protein SteCoe_5964 [Stentor coeruleus]